jgi:hypothetical protein
VGSGGSSVEIKRAAVRRWSRGRNQQRPGALREEAEPKMRKQKGARTKNAKKYAFSHLVIPKMRKILTFRTKNAKRAVTSLLLVPKMRKQKSARTKNAK